MNKLERINTRIENCIQCPRLINHCQNIASTKKRAHRSESYWGKPVPGSGDPNAHLWIVGLAPGAHGANRTGRMFTGDSSGDWLYRALYNVGLSNQPTSKAKNDGLKLFNTYISAAVRCAPPDNKPSRKELLNCRPFLLEELRALTNVKIILALGKIAFDSVFEILKQPKPKFIHGECFKVGKLIVFSSYHPSRQNTNTGRLTAKMWNSVFEDLKNMLWIVEKQNRG